MSCFLDMLLNLSQFQGYANEKGVVSLSCLNDASFVFFYVEMSACFLFDSGHLEERTGVRPWAHTTVGCSGLSWSRPAGRGTSEILSWPHPKWSIRVATWGSDSLEPESGSSGQRHFVLDINILDFMILLPGGHAKRVGITVRTMKSGGRCFLVLLNVILKKWHDLVIGNILKPHAWRKSRLKWTQGVSIAVKKGQGQAAQEPRGLWRF